MLRGTGNRHTLQHLDLAWSAPPTVSDMALRCGVALCRSLETLILNGLAQLTAEGLDAVLAAQHSCTGGAGGHKGLQVLALKGTLQPCACHVPG